MYSVEYCPFVADSVADADAVADSAVDAGSDCPSPTSAGIRHSSLILSYGYSSSSLTS